MGLSKAQRIMVLLAIDSAFFLLELIVGYTTHSLALVADSFHMLNDVLSLCVGLWAVKVAHKSTGSKMYTYGWQRAETLGALVNGVFLVALCLSIFLEAIQRFFEPQEVGNPRLVLIVGCFGLLSNILGLLLFHEHGHGHGGGGDEEVQVPETAIEVVNGDVRSPSPFTRTQYGTEAMNKGTATQESTKSYATAASQPPEDVPTHPAPSVVSPQVAVDSPQSAPPENGDPENQDHSKIQNSLTFSPSRRERRRTSISRSRYASSIDDIHLHPASFRNDIIAASRLESIESPPEGSDPEMSADETHQEPSEETFLIRQRSASKSFTDLHHASHKHRKPKDASDKHGHGHSHGDLNMRGVFLHVMGDALGNIGVIASALFIWQTAFPWRFYADPVISLIITVIILLSAIPLCRAASRILLQAVPAGLSIDDIREDIEDLPGVVGCHDLHVWQLSDTKLIASLHIQVAFDYQGTDAKQYMRLAKAVRTCLHEYGIHSSTIQPEFCLDAQHAHISKGLDGASSIKSGAHHGDGDAEGRRRRKNGHKSGGASSVASQPDPCLLDCGDGCPQGRGCCGPAPPSTEGDHRH